MPTIKGIDVSSWQGNIAWDKVKSAGIGFAMLRVGSGKRLDSFFVRNIKAAVKEGIPCGVYLYSLADTDAEALAEADFTIDAIKPYPIALPVAYDLEDKVQHKLTNSQRTAQAAAFCEAVANAGYRPMLYSSLSWFNTMIDLQPLAKCDFWVAQWGVPKCTFTGALSIWQYSNKGRIAGIEGDVDLNLMYGDYGLDGQAPQPTPPPLPPKPTIGRRILLKNAALYSSAYSARPVRLIGGAYFVYDGNVQNGRVRITNSLQNVGKTPIGKYVTGFISIANI